MNRQVGRVLENNYTEGRIIWNINSFDLSSGYNEKVSLELVLRTKVGNIEYMMEE